MPGKDVIKTKKAISSIERMVATHGPHLLGSFLEDTLSAIGRWITQLRCSKHTTAFHTESRISFDAGGREELRSHCNTGETP